MLNRLTCAAASSPDPAMADPDSADFPPEPPPDYDGDVARIKMQPHSIEAEQSVLGGLLLSADGWDGVAEVVAAEDFYRPDHRMIFRHVARLAEASEPVARPAR